jgi:hypothetical protein
MKFLDGFKTILGAVVLTASIVAPKFAPQINDAAPHVINLVQGGAGVLLALGIIHKREKKQGK